MEWMLIVETIKSGHLFRYNLVDKFKKECIARLNINELSAILN